MIVLSHYFLYISGFHMTLISTLQQTGEISCVIEILFSLMYVRTVLMVACCRNLNNVISTRKMPSDFFFPYQNFHILLDSVNAPHALPNTDQEKTKKQNVELQFTCLINIVLRLSLSYSKFLINHILSFHCGQSLAGFPSVLTLD